MFRPTLQKCRNEAAQLQMWTPSTSRAAASHAAERKTGAGGRAQGGGVGGDAHPTAADLQVLSEANGWMDGGWMDTFLYLKLKG